MTKISLVHYVQRWELVPLTVHCGHDESNLGGIGGAGEVGVDLLRVVLVQADEAVQNVVTSSGIIRATCGSSESNYIYSKMDAYLRSQGSKSSWG